jgi:hypothetical protein
MLAEIYGMMPRTNTENRSSAPPLNILYKLSNEPSEEEKNSVRAIRSIPGDGIKIPSLYTANIASVNKIRLRNAGSLNMSLIVENTS